jgi:hypothetical protein
VREDHRPAPVEFLVEGAEDRIAVPGYAQLAKSMGWYAEGPIDNPRELGPAIRRALAVVERRDEDREDLKGSRDFFFNRNRVLRVVVSFVSGFFSIL